MSRTRGFSLPELLVALALGSLAVAATLSAFALGRTGLQQAQAGSRLQERAFYLLSVLEPQVQLAGAYGLAHGDVIDTASVNSAAAHCGAGLAQRLARAVEAHAARWPLACTASGGGWLAGTDVLILRRGSVAALPPDPGRLQVLTVAGSTGSRLLVDGRLPADVALREGHAELHDLLVSVYYIARRADGDAPTTLPALRVKSLTRIGGSAAFLDTEVLPGVVDLRVQLGYRPSAAAPLQFVAPDHLPVNAQLLAVQLDLTLAASADEVGARQATRRLQVTRTIALRQGLAS